MEFRINKIGRQSSSQRAKVLNKKDDNRTTALHYAVRYGHVNIAKQLVEAGACKWKFNLTQIYPKQWQGSDDKENDEALPFWPC